MVYLCVEIVGIDIEGKTNLFDLDDFLILFSFLLTFSLLETVFTVIHNTANRRHSLRSDLYQIKTFFCCKMKCILCGHNAQLGSVCIYNAYFLVLDLLVDKQFLVADSSTPP